MKVDVRVLFHALSSRVCLDINKVQDWELLEEPQSCRSAWIQLLRKGAEWAQERSRVGSDRGWHPAWQWGALQRAEGKTDVHRKNHRK